MFCVVVKRLAKLTSVSTWCVAVDADVEELTVLGISVPWMGKRKRFVNLGAVELEEFCEQCITVSYIQQDKSK